ncbi:MAG: DNA gyrase subunit A [Bacteroidales bacterium]|jgi:DNA gyrase subunit A|nr:DNA gyrase subunit A [Bacteroidales bacterium]MCI2121728.1 DNA gyrase subunit A [Bacteroidales bacterium]MCI2145360.1 DNA gyrase subunit A [Bacteroidales bacterium]
MDFEKNIGKIIPINIEQEMQSAYIDYSMSVIVSRALPDVRDGLKPVHRRVLYGMDQLGVTSNSATKKSARIVGEVLGKYHPHGDSSVYDAMARLAQGWVMRYPLVQGQGNFGSVDGDPVAAMRYTEAKLNKLAETVLEDLDKDTVDFVPNFDESLQEPEVLPAKAPLLLLNGASGIAVGMATNMAPHNLTEVGNAICAYIDNPEITVGELMEKYIKGPDFPTGGIIQGIGGIRDAFETGRGRIVVRSKTEIEVSDSGRETIVVTEIPYMVNKRELIEKIADLVNNKKIEGISYINDESDRKGMRIVIKLKMGANSNVLLNNLYKMTDLESAFSVNNIALVDGRPRLLNLKDLIKYFVRHRHNVVVRRTRFNLNKALKRQHILAGLLKAIDIIDEIIALIRASRTVQEAHDGLMSKWDFSSAQADAIVEMKLRALTGLEREKLQQEYDDLTKLIADLEDILAHTERQMEIVKKETRQLVNDFGDARRTAIEISPDEMDADSFYPDEDVVITISHMGYIKRTSLSEYRSQNRGGIGSKGSTTREEDFIERIYVANMHSTMLFFTSFGKCYWLKVYNIPEGTKASKGRAIQNVIQIEQGDKVQTYLNVRDLDDKEFINSHYIILATKRGIVKKTVLEMYSRPRQKGVNAINIVEGDAMVDACLTDGNSHILIACGKAGKLCRFPEDKVRSIGRTATGVRGIYLDNGDEVVGMVCIAPDEDADAAKTVLVVSSNGFGKRSVLDDYRITNRGGKGVKTLNITEKTGSLIAVKAVSDNDDLMIINKSGITIRMPVESIRVAGRATQGVKLISLREGDEIAAVCVVPKSDEDGGDTPE